MLIYAGIALREEGIALVSVHPFKVVYENQVLRGRKYLNK